MSCQPLQVTNTKISLAYPEYINLFKLYVWWPKKNSIYSFIIIIFYNILIKFIDKIIQWHLIILKIFTDIYIYIYICVCVCVYTCIYIYMYIYIYIYIYNTVCILYPHHLVHLIFLTLEEEDMLFIYNFPLIY